MNYLKWPFLLITPSFILGIVLANFGIAPMKIGAIFLIISILILINFFIKFGQQIKTIIILIIAFFSGSSIFDLHNNTKLYIPSGKTFYKGIIIEEPKENQSFQNLIVKITCYQSDSEKIYKNFKVYLKIQNDTIKKFEYGDEILFKTRLEKIVNLNNPGEFDFAKYLKTKKIFYTANIKSSQILITNKNKASKIIAFAKKLRKNLLKIYQKYNINNEEYAIISALSLGYKDELDFETKQIFSKTGTMHILAVSGLHVGAIFLVLNTLLKFLEKKKLLSILKSLIILFSLWLFALISGLSPSIVRACLMLSLIIIAKLINRTTNIYNVIAASAFIILSINPNLLFDVGFQLSYSAVLSILLLQPLIYKLIFIKNKILDYIWSLISVSIAAQIGTMPLGFYYFNQFPNYFFIANIFAVPFATLILYCSLFLLLLNFLPLIPNLLAFILTISTKILYHSIKFIHNIPYSYTDNIFFEPVQIFILYVIIILIFTWLHKRNSKYFYFSLIAIATFFSINFFRNYEILKPKIISYNFPNKLVIQFIDNKNNILLTSDSLRNYEKNIINKFSLSQKKHAPVIISLDTNFYQTDNFIIINGLIIFNSKKIVLSPYLMRIKNIKNIDYILVKDDYLPDSLISDNCEKYKIILSNDNSKSFLKKFQNSELQSNIILNNKKALWL